ncbi:MAG: hypothetical protein QOF48_1799 [Verrucomicrobiota bacterium]|jgi:uncharacterized protein (DUF1501 family)
MQKSNLNVITRRGFLGQTAKAGIAAGIASLVDIPLVVKRALAEGSIGLNGKKVLFIWLRGANDALNSVIPIQDSAYASSRPTIGIPKDPSTNYSTVGLADVPLAGSAGSTYGAYPFGIRLGNGFAALHPVLKFLAPVYNAGELALVHRVAYPRQSRSHFDSQAYWETGYPNNTLVREGILYRAMVESGLANTAPLTGVSIQSSLPLLLRGSEAAMTNLTDPNRYDLLGIPNNASGNIKATNALSAANLYPFPTKINRDLLRLQYSNMEKTLGVFAGINFTEAGNTFRDNVKTDDDTDWYPQGQASNDADGYYLFPTTNVKNGGWRRPDGTSVFNKYAVDPAEQSFFANLKAAALVLNKTDAIVAGTELGGFDTHKTEGQFTGPHPNLNRAIGWSIYALRKYFTRYADKAMWNNVVVVTFSEFGRTTVENSDLGTDHAEANVMFVAGGSVKGYQHGNASGVFGCSPGDAIPWLPGPRTSNLNTCGTMFAANTTIEAGYLRRSCDYRSVLGEIIRKHLGATQPQLDRIIPGYADNNEHLLSGGASTDGVMIRGEVGIL